MKAKRIFSAFLTILMLASVLASYPAVNAAADASTVITETSPAIPADAGKKVNLTSLKVMWNGKTVSGTDIVWKKDSKTITSYTPGSKGVYALTATYGGKTRNFYIVAKNKTDTEYVLYENDFSGTLADLEKDGWVFLNKSATSVSGGVLHLGTINGDYYRAILPAWLGDFGDYSITAMANQTNIKDTARWCSIVYRIENANGNYYPYYHMCVRAKTTNSTVEFAERTTANQWNVIYKTSETLDMTVANQYHELRVDAFENVVDYRIDGESVMFMTDATAHTKGFIGLNDNYGTMNVDSIRVTLQTEAPERPPVVPELIDSSANRSETNIANYVSNQAYATPSTVQTFLSAKEYPVAILLDLTETTVKQADFEKYLNAFSERNIIPEFKLDSKSQVDLLVKAIAATKVPEVLVASADANIVKYARNKQRTVIRGAYDLSELTADRLTDDELYGYYNTAAGAYAQAVILPYQLATKETVAALQEFELAVWAFGTGINTSSEAAWLIASGANAVISDNPSQVDNVQSAVFDAVNSLTRTPVWTGHRGYPAKYPENSVSGCLGAIADGSDCVEIDVKLSADGHVVVMHDDTIDRTTNGTGNIMQMTLAKIKTYKLKHNNKVTDESIPTFEEILKALKGKDIKILCEFKSTQAKLAEKCAALIEEYGMEDQVVFICFNANMLTSIKNHMNTSTGYLLSAPSFVSADDKVGTLNAYESLQTQTLSYNATMAVNYGNITYEFLRDANDRGVTLWSWTYGQYDSVNVSKMFLAGMNGMTTDNVGILKNTLKTISAPANISIGSNGSASYLVQSETYGGTVKNITADAEVIVLENNGIVKIGTNGKLTALKNGVATFMVSYESKLPNGAKFTLYSQPITVKVGNLPELKPTDKSYTLENGYLSGIKADTEVGELLSKIENADEVTVYDTENNRVTDTSSLIGTGYTLSFRGVDTTVVVFGDLDGDGMLTAKDYILLKRGIVGMINLNDTQKQAADTDGSNSLNVKDYVILKRAFLGAQ